MKSKEIRVRNLPKDDVPFYVSNVKPTSFLIIAMIAGICFLWIRTYLQVIGVMVDVYKRQGFIWVIPFKYGR